MVNSLYEETDAVPSRIDYPITAALQQDREEQMAKLSLNTWERLDATLNDHGRWIQCLGYLLALTLVGAATFNIVKKNAKKNKNQPRRMS